MPKARTDRLRYDRIAGGAYLAIVLVRLKTPWRDGTSHVALQPVELLEKLAALIPRPYVNLIVYHGLLAPNAKWRRESRRTPSGVARSWTSGGPGLSAHPRQ
jgi:hypothetical protein